MFRQKALKKGALKTINAQTGIMVGEATGPGAPVPALIRNHQHLRKEC